MKWTNRYFPQNRPCVIYYYIYVCGKAELRLLLTCFSFLFTHEMRCKDVIIYLLSPAFLFFSHTHGCGDVGPIFMCRRRRRRCSTSSSSRLSTHRERERMRERDGMHRLIIGLSEYTHVCWWMIMIHILLCSVDLQDINTHHIHSQNQSTQTDFFF